LINIVLGGGKLWNANASESPVVSTSSLSDSQSPKSNPDSPSSNTPILTSALTSSHSSTPHSNVSQSSSRVPIGFRIIRHIIRHCLYPHTDSSFLLKCLSSLRCIINATIYKKSRLSSFIVSFPSLLNPPPLPIFNWLINAGIENLMSHDRVNQAVEATEKKNIESSTRLNESKDDEDKINLYFYILKQAWESVKNPNNS
jgi:hypothetical protein